jgi:hypothetical protein
MNRAGKALSPVDATYMTDLKKKGLSDEEVIARAEQRLLDERAELVKQLKKKGISIDLPKEVEVSSEGVLGAGLGVRSPKGESKLSQAPKSSEKESSTVQSKELDPQFAEKAKPGKWSTPKGESKTSYSGAYRFSRTYDSTAPNGYLIALSHETTDRTGWQQIGFYNTAKEAKAAALQHWEDIYRDEKDIDVDQVSPKSTVKQSESAPPTEQKTKPKAEAEAPGADSAVGTKKSPGQGGTLPGQKASPKAKSQGQGDVPAEDTPEGEVKFYRNRYENKYGAGKETAAERGFSIDYVNHTVQSMLERHVQHKGAGVVKNVHNLLYQKAPLYMDVMDKMVGIYNNSKELQGLVHAITGEGANKLSKADLLAKVQLIHSAKMSQINNNQSSINRLSQNLSKQEKSDLHDFISKMPLHDYFAEAYDLDTVEKIETAIEVLRKELWGIKKQAVRDVDSLVDMNVDGNITGNLYNLAARYPTSGDFGIKLHKLLALESIKRIGTKKFVNLLKHKELMDVVADNSLANRVATLKNEGLHPVRDSLMKDQFGEDFEIKAVNEKAFKTYDDGDEAGWQVLQTPTRTRPGIVYRKVIESTDLRGAFTDIKLASTDVDVDEHMKSYPGVVQTQTGYKYVLTDKQKAKLGRIETLGVNLTRTAANSNAILESQVIRDELIKKEKRAIIRTKRDQERVIDAIEAKNIDAPWFIKLDTDVEYSDLPAAIRARYMPVKGRASDVKNFNDEVDLVRKDISHWLIGGRAGSLFKNPQMQWAVRILKNAVTGAKISMVVLNPIKIANDNLSNIAYLGTMGVGLGRIAQTYNTVFQNFESYTEIQNQIAQAKLKLLAHPESAKLKKKVKHLQKRLKNNPIGDVGDKGFVNSLGSDLVSRSADTLSGFEADAHKALEYLLHDKRGRPNYLSHFIERLSGIGFQAENFIGYLADIASKAESTEMLHKKLDHVADRLHEIKDTRDMVNYVAQITTSPSSELVRMGSAMTDLTDVTAKQALYDHLVEDKGESPENARIIVLDSFPDYKENLPLAVKQMSDAGFIMFPSFWLRIQKIIYRMAKDRPISLATEMMTQEAIGSDINTIFESNIVNKSNTFGGVFHTPVDHVGVGSFFPTEIW